MADTFITFQKFNDIELAKEMAKDLEERGIQFLLEDNRKFFDPSFANNAIESDISIKIKPDDFTKAHKALEDFYKKDVENIDKGYYLFEFSDNELIEIISKPDEWGYFDYQLAQKLLKERGKEIKPEGADLLKTQRLKDLSKPDTVSRGWIYFGYFVAVFGGIFGVFIGCAFAYFKKTLPNGQKVYAYSEGTRNHGLRIILIGAITFVFWWVIRWRLLNN